MFPKEKSFIPELHFDTGVDTPGRDMMGRKETKIRTKKNKIKIYKRRQRKEKKCHRKKLNNLQMKEVNDSY